MLDLETKKEILSRLLEESQSIICRETNAADSQDFLYGEDGIDGVNVENIFGELNEIKENGECTSENTSKIAQDYPEHEFVRSPL